MSSRPITADAAYQGRPGAYSEAAARRFCRHDATLLPCDTLPEVFEACASGRARHAVVPVENTIAGDAFRPGDVLASRKGLTVEIGNTDAEGRLILADALSLADEEAPELVFDFATLTGEDRVALGARSDLGLLGDVIRYVDAQPEAESFEILGRWSGTAAHGALVRLFETPELLDDHALQGEFTQGITRLRELLGQGERRQLLSQMKDAPSRENFQAFWSRLQGGGASRDAAVRGADAAEAAPAPETSAPGDSADGESGAA